MVQETYKMVRVWCVFEWRTVQPFWAFDAWFLLRFCDFWVWGFVCGMLVSVCVSLIAKWWGLDMVLVMVFEFGRDKENRRIQANFWFNCKRITHFMITRNWLNTLLPEIGLILDWILVGKIENGEERGWGYCWREGGGRRRKRFCFLTLLVPHLSMFLLLLFLFCCCCCWLLTSIIIFTLINFVFVIAIIIVIVSVFTC